MIQRPTFLPAPHAAANATPASASARRRKSAPSARLWLLRGERLVALALVFAVALALLLVAKLVVARFLLLRLEVLLFVLAHAKTILRNDAATILAALRGVAQLVERRSPKP
jgi:hypothetical protein